MKKLSLIAAILAFSSSVFAESIEKSIHRSTVKQQGIVLIYITF